MSSNWLNNLLPAIEAIPGQVAQTAGDVGQSFQVPIQQLGHAALPKIIPDVTSQQQQQATQGSEFAMAPYSLADPANSVVGSTLDTAATAAKPVVKAAVDETKANVEANGGAQAGFIGMGKKATSKLPPIVSKVVAPDAAKSVFGAEHTAAIQDALQRNGVQDYNGIAPAAHNLYDNIIKPELFNNPKPVNIQDVSDAIVSEMRKAKPGIDPMAAERAAKSVLNDMYDRARAATGNTEPVPTHIDTPSLFGIKQGLNSTDAVKDYYNGNPPQNLTDSATVASRNAISNIIQKAHPGVAQATKDYGLLQDAVPSIYKATQDEAGNLSPWQKFRGQSPFAQIGEFGGAVAGTKALLPTIGSVVGAAGALAKPAEDSVLGALGYTPKGMAADSNYNTQPNKHVAHNGIVPDLNNNYNLPVQTTAGTTYMTNAQRQQAEANLDPSSPQYVKIEQKYQDDQTKAAKQLPNNTQSFMLNAPTYMNDINQSNKDLQTMPRNLLTTLNSTQKWNAYLSNPKNPYAKQVADLGKLNADFIEAYSAINGSFPSAMESSLIGAGDSTQQAQEKWSNIIDYVTQQYTVPGRQDAFMAVNTPAGYQTDNGGKVTTPAAPIPQSASSGQGVATGGENLIPLPTTQ